MSFVESEHEQIRRYLGYPISPGAIANVLIRCNAVQAHGLAGVETVRQTLRELAIVEQQMRSARPFAGQTFNSGAGGAQSHSPGLRLQTLKDEARRLVWELGHSLSLPIERDIFGPPSAAARTIRG